MDSDGEKLTFTKTRGLIPEPRYRETMGTPSAMPRGLDAPSAGPAGSAGGLMSAGE